MILTPTYIGLLLPNIRKDIKAFPLTFKDLGLAEAFLPIFIIVSCLNKIVNNDSCRKMIH